MAARAQGIQRLREKCGDEEVEETTLLSKLMAYCSRYRVGHNEWHCITVLLVEFNIERLHTALKTHGVLLQVQGLSAERTVNLLIETDFRSMKVEKQY